MKEVIYDGETGDIISEEGEELVHKSVYSKADFMALIPKAKIREIQTAAVTNDDINVWIFNLSVLQGDIDLAALPAWFIEGIDAMVTEGIVTQNQADAFLER